MHRIAYQKLEEVRDVYPIGFIRNGADKIKKYAPQGLRGFVLGTTLLFGKGRPCREILADIRQLKF